MFRPAKVFRRTGKHSYAVQLEGSPGVVEVHCVEEDWGALASTWTAAHALEDRLCVIGTRNMYNCKSGKVKKEQQHKHVEWREGVVVELGSYDVRRRAFVQCRLRVNGSAQDFLKEEGMQEKTEEEELVEAVEIATPPQRRVFKWSVWN